MIEQELIGHQNVLKQTIELLSPTIYQVADIVCNQLQGGHKVLLCGNGGSAADAQHIAAEITGRYKSERKGLPAIALTTDTSALTAIANDYGYERVFARQVEALAQKGDLLIGISTSGHSENVCQALSVAKEAGCHTIGFSGKDGGKMNQLCDINLVIPSHDTPRIQEMHMLIGHIIAQAVDDAYDLAK